MISLNRNFSLEISLFTNEYICAIKLAFSLHANTQIPDILNAVVQTSVDLNGHLVPEPPVTTDYRVASQSFESATNANTAGGCANAGSAKVICSTLERSNASNMTYRQLHGRILVERF